ncbi:MAG: DUF1304 domain-containing protein [Sulfitobacter sp.]
MSVLALILVFLIAVLHVGIAWLEMFAWETRGPKVFTSLPADLFKPTKVLAANQGLYNGFLAAGLLWSLFIGDEGWQQCIAVFFLLCVAIAGGYGAMTVSKKILYVQAVPAFVALLLIFIL